MKKIFLLMMMAVCAMGMQAKVDKVYATYKSVSNGNIELGADGKTFNVKGSSNNTYQMFEFEAGTLKDYQTLNLNLEAKEVEFVRLLFMTGNNTAKTQFYYNTGKKTFNLTTELTADQLASITSIRIGGPNSGNDTYPATFVLDPASVYLETKDYECLTIKTTLDASATASKPFQWYTSSEDKSEITKTTKTSLDCKKFNTTGIKEVVSLVGSNLGWGNGFIDVTGYEKLCVNVPELSDSYDKAVRILRTTGYNNSTQNVVVNLTKSGANEAAINESWICGIWSSGSNKCQSIESFVFSKDFNAASTTAFSIAESTSSTIEYDRTFVAGQKTTVCLPFRLAQSELANYGEFYYISGGNGDQISFTKAQYEVTAYRPYIFIPKEDGKLFANITNKAVPAYTDANMAQTKGAYTFTGVLSASSDVALDNEGKDVYGWSATNGEFVKVGDGVSINAFRAYVTTPKGSGAKNLVASFDDGSVTEVEATEAEAAPRKMEMYNIAGQRVSANARGLLIVNGKKMFRF